MKHADLLKTVLSLVEESADLMYSLDNPTTSERLAAEELNSVIHKLKSAIVDEDMKVKK